jgi:hypothetical protein
MGLVEDIFSQQIELDDGTIIDCLISPKKRKKDANGMNHADDGKFGTGSGGGKTKESEPKEDHQHQEHDLGN